MAFASLVGFLVLLIAQVGADYVETAPRPGRPPPMPIPVGECPLVYLTADKQRSVAVCSADGSFTSPAGPSPACCSQVNAVLYPARVRYANSTGRLLLPQASAQACVQALDATLGPTGPQTVAVCNISSAMLAEETGAACGLGLTHVYDFWDAANHTFPGLVGLACYEAVDCSSCLGAIRSKILSLGGDATTLGSAACQGLGQVAMTAASYPPVIANGLGRCLYATDIAPVTFSPSCPMFDWERANFTAVQLSCGAQQVRKDRCCDLIIGMYGQVHAPYMNRTGHPIPQEYADACWIGLRSALAVHGVSPSTLDACRIPGILPAGPIGCYNQTAAGQLVPTRYLDQLESVCTFGQGNCAVCQRAYFEVGAELTNSTNVRLQNMCVLFMSAQYLARIGADVAAVTERLNCYFNFPPPLALGLPNPPPKRFPTLEVAFAAASAGVVLVGIVALVGVWVCHRRWRRPQILPHVQLQRYSLKQLRRATDNFDRERLLGQGGHGRVYLGHLSNGEAVAIKVATNKNLSKRSKIACREVLALARCRHRNLTAIRGFCLTGSDCLLVFDYMEGGTLGDRLLSSKAWLRWSERLNIALGTARALAYLHESCRPQVIHRDVKPSNILLSAKLEPRVADFGLAKVLCDGADNHSLTTAAVGTWGYVAPEIVMGQSATEAVDVYSFGVVLLVLVAGRKPIEQMDNPEEVYLAEWAWILAERGRLADLADPRLGVDREEHADSIERATKVALLCLQTAASARPSMSQAAAMLDAQLALPPLPARPTTLYTCMAAPSPAADP